MANALFLSILWAAIFSSSEGYPTNRAKIPNGYNVPNPCNESLIWNGVGHKNSGGGGPLNPFGEDFRANNQVWNRTVCQMDSDGDGKPNGEELGDPNCIWTPGSTPTYTTNISHPGICDPIGSPNCTSRNSWLMNCNSSSEKFNCPAINDPDHKINEPFKCGMGGGVTCLSLIGIWGVGVSGQCFSNEFGFRIGPDGFQYALLQLHWNNPQTLSNLVDSSGMKLYYTRNLRPNKGGIVVVGQNYLEIPPFQQEVTFTGRCSSACTRQLPQSVFLESVVLHMHLTGKSGNVSLYRNGGLLTLLDDVKDYDYNMPKFVTFENKIEVKPGDQIKVVCTYQSTSRNKTIYFGEGTSDEMCYAFISYYPLFQNFDFCAQWKGIDQCSFYGQDVYFEKCDFQTFLLLVGSLSQVCSQGCRDEYCMSRMQIVYATGCYKYADVKAFLQFSNPKLGNLLAHCASEVPPTNTEMSTRVSVSKASGLNILYGSAILWGLVAYANYHRTI